MARRKIGQERFLFSAGTKQTELDKLDALVDWSGIDGSMADISCSSKGEAGWPPLCMFKAFLLARWYDLSDVKLADALDDRASFRRFCGFARHEPTPERTAFVRFRKALVERGLGDCLFDIITGVGFLCRYRIGPTTENRETHLTNFASVADGPVDNQADNSPVTAIGC